VEKGERLGQLAQGTTSATLHDKFDFLVTLSQNLLLAPLESLSLSVCWLLWKAKPPLSSIIRSSNHPIVQSRNRAIIQSSNDSTIADNSRF
jgi:hypothetical protein